MAKPKQEELQKHTLNLRRGDMDALAVLFPRSSPSVMIRRLVSRYIDRVSAVKEEQVELGKPIDLPFE